MTLAQIMTLALRQLDEDPEDISEFDDLFRVYANMGYRIAVSEHVKPRDMREVRTDENGEIYLDPDVRRIVELYEKKAGVTARRNVIFELSADGERIKTTYANKSLVLVCEVSPGEMETGNDEPVRLPEEAHHALVDYVCYRHLLNGNMAKQSRAQQYLQQFYQAMERIRPQGMGSVKGFTNLYTATDIRYTR